jgi:radical SAM superfamily enzyme YgiQ (UPF0313 family)
MDCEFCSVTSFNGRTYRQRPVEEVLDELEALNCKELFFTDDNIVGYGKKAEDRAIKLFRGMIDRGLKKRWFAQAGIDIADNPVVLEYAKNSGCMGLLIGFESINDEALRSMKKVRNLKVGVGNYKELIKKIRDHGICVDAAFIFGNDEDGKDVFQRTTEFILDSKIDVEQLTILTPLPGTRLYNRLKLEGRLLRINYPDDWKHYDFMEAVFMPKHMTPLELEEGVYQVAMNITGRVTSLKRALNSVIQVKSPFSGIFAYVWNRGVHSIAARQYEYVKAQDLLRLNDSYKSHPVRYGERSKSEIGSTH